MNDLDRTYWYAVSGWEETTGRSWLIDGVDYAVLTRWFLWDKVGRALRGDHDPDPVGP